MVVVQKCNEERIRAALPQKLRNYPAEEALCGNVLRDAALLCSLCRNSDGLLCDAQVGTRTQGSNARWQLHCAIIYLQIELIVSSGLRTVVIQPPEPFACQ